MKIHACCLDAQCVEHDAPKRLHISSRLGMVLIGAPAQMWWPVVGYTDVWWPISYHPPREPWPHWTHRWLVLPSHQERMTHIPLIGLGDRSQ
jgi:hypothetical protein